MPYQTKFGLLCILEFKLNQYPSDGNLYFNYDERIGDCEILNEWDMEKLAIEKSQNYVEELKRYMEGEYRGYCQ